MGDADGMAIPLSTTRERIRAGESTSTLATAVRRGRLLRIRPGAFVEADAWNAAPAVEQHRAMMDALVLTLPRRPVFALESAALLHGIPVIGGWPDRPRLLESELLPASRRSPIGARVHRPQHLPEVAEVSGYWASVPRDTAIALAASRSVPGGVAAIDHVLATGLPRVDLERVVDLWRPFHGAGRATRALDLATGLAETPLESISLAGILLAGLPAPLQQVELGARGCRYRLDFLWPELGVAGEADGRAKYETADDLWAEKRREDDIRSTGLRSSGGGGTTRGRDRR